MDVNGSRHWGLHDRVHWPLDPAALDSAAVVWQRCTQQPGAPGVLQLRSGLPPGTLAPLARSRLPLQATVDAEGALLWWDGRVLLSVGASFRGEDGQLQTPAPVVVDLPPEITRIAAMALGDDGVLYLASGETLWWVDRRGRALPQPLATPGFAATALAARPGEGVWALDAATGRLARTQGRPVPRQGVVVDEDDGAHFHPLQAQPDPARLITLQARLRPDDQGVALAVRPDGLLAVLVQRSGAALARGETPAALHLLSGDEQWTPAFELGGGWAPFHLAWRDETQLVLLGQAALRDAAGQEQRNSADTVALAYAVEPQTLAEVLAGADEAPPRLAPAGDYLPLPGHDGGPLLVAPPASRQALQARAGERAARNAAVGYVRRGGTLQVLNPASPAEVQIPALGLRPLVAVPQPRRVQRGWRANALPAWSSPQSDPVLAPSIIDSHDPRTTWGRLWLEAEVPRGCALVIWLAASDAAPPRLPRVDDPFFGSAEVGDRPGLGSAWWPHLVGDRAALPQALAAWPGLPRAAWHATPTEVLGGLSRLPHAGNGQPARPGEAGLFEVLVQRAGLAVRSLAGRRLWVVVEFFGNGRDSPALAALRATGSRFSYRDQYLPALYGEPLQGEAAGSPGRAGGADFLERLLALFEGEFTRTEGRIAEAHRLTQPGSCPPEALAWLGRWLGLSFDPALPAERRRQLLAAMPLLWPLHGTARGLELAIELATGGRVEGDRITGGAVSGGEAVVVEHWRLRRTAATILGAELFDRDDPLVAGLVRSGNSLVGDSLVLGDPLRSEFLALFRRLTQAPAAGRRNELPGLPALEPARDAARRALFDDLAHRVTVLVHVPADRRSLSDPSPGPGAGLTEQDLGLIRRVAELQAPAHVRVQVQASTTPFLCAVASLVGVDSYLLAGPPQQPFTLGASGQPASPLGGTDRLGEGATLDDRLAAFGWANAPAGEGALPEAAPPQARMQAPAVGPGAPWQLDASGSRAAPGRSLVAWRWRLNTRPQ